MFQLPDSVQKQFGKILSDKGISIAYQPYYRKRLRFYYDFCLKYGLPESNLSSLPLFKNRLGEKNLKEFQINQAVHAVSLFCEIAAIPDGVKYGEKNTGFLIVFSFRGLIISALYNIRRFCVRL